MNKIQIVFCVLSINLIFSNVMNSSQVPTSILSLQEAGAPVTGVAASIILISSLQSARIDRQTKSAFLKSELDFVRRMTPLQPLGTVCHVGLRQDVSMQTESAAEFKLNPHAQSFEPEFARAWSAKQKSMKNFQHDK